MDISKYGDMVHTLAKSGYDIVREITPVRAHLWHMATGISGEVGEILQAITDFPMDRENIVEGLGDYEFYAEGYRQPLARTWGQLQVIGASLQDDGFLNYVEDTYRTNLCDSTLHVDLTIAAAKLLDQTKKLSVNIKDMDKGALNDLITTLYKVDYYIGRIYDYYDISREEALEHNMKKLGKRYKGFEYSNQAAQERADKKEEALPSYKPEDAALFIGDKKVEGFAIDDCITAIKQAGQ